MTASAENLGRWAVMPVKSFDMAKSREGWQILFRLNDPLRMARHTRHIAAMPFVP